ncbi:MAG: DeoR/GlpR family DNA-binding transcription regulator [Defluviitaleaceae bacterium]|nr:DeoR/GlpR family DNA-binding transcription regulator [Defluviitaleaceae bacterium]
MLESERLELIFSTIQKKQIISNDELRKMLFISSATLRRDLLKLENNGLIVRVRGGVSLASKANQEVPYYIREVERLEEKEHICNLAKEYIKDDQAYFMDSSSTVGNLCEHMWDSRIVVITNCLKNALVLGSYRNVSVYITGGGVKKNSNSVVGEVGKEYISNFNAEIAFISCRGLDPEGIYEASFAQARIKQHMVANSKRVVLMCDDSKFDNRHFINLITYDKIDIIITNTKPDQKYLDLFAEHNCEVRW